MSEKTEKKQLSKAVGPFMVRINAPAKKDFDKYYDDVSVKEVYRSAGKDADGVEYGVIERKLVFKKIDISELINSQADTVGVEAYMKALSIQGVSADDFFTNVDLDKVNDYTDAPDNKFDGALYGKKAVQLFDSLDPELKGGHTTIEGFLNSLSKESVEKYIRSKVDAIMPKKTEGDAN